MIGFIILIFVLVLDESNRYGAKNPSCDYMAHGPMDQVLQRLIESFNTLLIPVRSIQLDDWWYIGNEIDSHDHM